MNTVNTNTIEPSSSLWERVDPKLRTRIMDGLWGITWIALAAGYLDRRAWVAVVALSAAQAVAFALMMRGGLRPFPVQVRVAYVMWVALGTWAPGLEILMHITLVGLAANLAVGYCPLARMMSLLPWNRQEPLTGSLVARTFTTPPVAGRFRPRAQPS